MSSLSERAMLVTLSISCWTAKRQDKRVSQEAETQHNTARNVLKTDKTLVPKEALEPVTKAATAARTYLYDNTLAWGRKGEQLLPSAHYLDFSANIRQLRLAYEAEVETFLGLYPSLKDAAPARMGGLYNAADYPSVMQLRRRFGFDIEILPMPSAADFRVSISDGERSRIADDIESRTNARVQAAVAETWGRLHEVVNSMAGSLRDYVPAAEGARAQNVFRDSLVENIRQLVAVLPALNFTGDQQLAQMVRDVEARLCQHDAAELRSDDQLRASITAEADALLAQMAGFAAPIAA